ncbi:MAG: SpoIIE family protein phosphatase, partial [bacterium]
SKVLNSALDVNVLLSLVYDLIVAAVNCETCSLGLLDEKGNKINVLMGFGRTGSAVKGISLPTNQGVMGRVIQSGSVILINNPKRLARHRDILDISFSYTKLNSLGVPLKRGGKIIGALEAINKEGGKFTSKDRRMLASLADQIAIALDNAALYQRVKREIKERELLYEVSKRISSSLDLNEVMGLILDSLQEVVRYDAGGIYLVDPDSSQIVAVTTRGYDPEAEKRVELKFGEGIVGWVANNQNPVIVPNVSRDERYLAVRESTQSEVVVPLMVGDRIVGIINLESDRLDAFTDEHVNLIKTFGSQAAISIERAKLHADQIEKERLESEIQLARQIQQSFLPQRLPSIDGFELSAINISSEEVGGDYYDVIAISEGQWGLVIADVFGKGIPASLVMASFRASLLAEIRNNYSISTIVSKVNRLIWESVEPERCVTACYGVLDAKERVLTYSNAGHTYPIVFGKDGVKRLFKGGMLLGAFEDAKYEEERVHLSSGDVVVFFTDGVTESEDEKGEPFGETRLLEVIKSSASLDGDKVADAIYRAVWEYSNGKLLDDLTLLVLKAK